MQAFTDVPVKCCDCKKSFFSASSLLVHFTQHAKEQIENNHEQFKTEVGEKNSLLKKIIFKRSTWNKGKQTTPLNSPESSSYSEIASEHSISCESIDSKGSANGYLTSGNGDNAENTLEVCSSSSSMVTLKQTRLDDVNNDLCSASIQNKNNNATKIEIYSSNPDKVVQNKNSLKCTQFLTADEIVSNIVYNCKRKLSNRKQLMPKKIERTSDGLIKIAPRPESIPLDYGREIQTKKNISSKKKYSCHMCSKVFGWSTDLKRHILTHTGERPFKCKKCSACFTRNFLLQKHQTKLHPCNVTEDEKRKILEDKVTENLKELKSKMLEIEKEQMVVKEETEDHEQINEEMEFEESKLDIKEEKHSPSWVFEDSFSNNGKLVNGNWVFNKNYHNNNNVEEYTNKDCKKCINKDSMDSL